MEDSKNIFLLLHKYGLLFFDRQGDEITIVDESELDGFSTDRFSKLEQILLTKNVRKVEWNGLGRYSFNSFEVDSENPVFQQVSGVLYTKKGYDRYGNSSKRRMIELVACPTNIENHNVIQDTIRIANCAFKGSHIMRLTLPNTLEEIGVNTFYFTDRLKHIEIPNSIKKIEQQKESSLSSIKYDNHTFQNWDELFDYMLGHGFVIKNNNIERKAHQ